MPRKYSKRKGSKRYYKGKVKFSKSKLYAHRSAKNQAKQIYVLNKKMKNMYRKIKPDINTQTYQLNPSSTMDFTAQSVVNYLLPTVEILGSTQLASINANADYVNIRDVRFWMSYRFNGLTDATQPLYIRLVFVKLKIAGTFPTPANIWNANADPYLKVRGPLKAGLYDTGYKVIYDFKYKITYKNPNLDLKLNFKVGKFDKPTTGNQPAKSIQMYTYFYNPNFNSAVNHSEGKMFGKIAYDQLDTITSN